MSSSYKPKDRYGNVIGYEFTPDEGRTNEFFGGADINKAIDAGASQTDIQNAFTQFVVVLLKNSKFV